MAEEKILEGIGASPGRVKGKVKILLKPEDGVKMNEGDILVAPETTPEYTLAILRASAIITDHGGNLSHPAIVSREMGIPGIVGTEKATEALEDGVEVIADGDKGQVSKESN